MPAYDAQLFNPPAPLARVTLRNSAGGNAVTDVPMLVDSGADVTLVPQHSVDLVSATVDPSTSPHYSWFLEFGLKNCNDRLAPSS